MKRTTIIGGINNPSESLEDLAEELIKSGYTDDIAMFSFREAMDGRFEEVKKATNKSDVITHSAGILAVSSEFLPETVNTVAGPEPRKIGQLILGGLRLAGNVQLKSITGPKRTEHASLNIKKAKEAFIHPLGNLRHLKTISSFSTSERLAEMRDSGIAVKPFAMIDDEFFPSALVAERYFQNLINGNEVDPELIQIKGGHDHLLIFPEDFTEELTQKSQ